MEVKASTASYCIYTTGHKSIMGNLENVTSDQPIVKYETGAVHKVYY